MTTSEAEAGWEVEPGPALEAVARHRGPVVVDVDETLLLGNTTAHFLAAARPYYLAYLVVKLADLLSRGHRGSRDVRRVRTVLWLMPWVLRRWRRTAEATAADLVNRPLVAALARTSGPIVVSTMGFRPIVEPLLAHVGLDPERTRLVAMEPGCREDRAEVKAARTVEAVGAGGMACSLVVTDSLDDRRLLATSAVPLRVVWPGIRAAPLFSTVYVPGRYLIVKRPRTRSVRRIVMDDLALWILGSIWLSERPLIHALGLVVLAISFWAAYEYGYVDNDRMAERYEADPVLSDLFHLRLLEIPAWKPALWAIATGAVGLWVLRWPEPPTPGDHLRWFGVLALTVGLFGFYNRIDKQTRVLVYPLLQLLRGGAFLAVVATTAIADAALIILALTRWVSYYLYRSRDGRWPGKDLTAVRFIVFVAAAVLLSAQHDWADLVAPTTLSLLAWSAFLARRALPATLRSAHRIDRP